MGHETVGTRRAQAGRLLTLLTATLFAAPHAAASDDVLALLPDAAAEYTRRAAATATERCAAGEAITLDVALSEAAPLLTTFDTASGRLHILYRMSFNQLTEGWNWHPLEAMQGEDYYVFKYLPLGSVSEERGNYHAEDKIGAPQEFRVQWRTDYFFAFDNPYDFYPRDANDDAGFVAEFAVAAADATRLARGDLRLALSGRLAAECLSASTTFWKATSATPVDFTLKKRYLIGKLSAVWFYDAASGKVLARLTQPSATSPAR